MYNNIIDAINDFADGKISYYYLFSNFGYVELTKYKKFIETAKIKNAINTSGLKNMKVLYICGSSGSGKTTTAKYIADKMGLPYCVSAGGVHMFDEYQQEPCLILDDFRSSYLKFSDLLKLLDNNTGSAMDARYHNVSMAFCRLLIITSIHRPNELYSSILEKDEPLEQLIRRLNNRTYLHIVKNGNILEVNADTNIPTGKSLGNFKKDILPLYKSNNDENIDLDCLFI